MGHDDWESITARAQELDTPMFDDFMNKWMSGMDPNEALDEVCRTQPKRDASEASKGYQERAS